jgi:hypothetical protein
MSAASSGGRGVFIREPSVTGSTWEGGNPSSRPRAEPHGLPRGIVIPIMLASAVLFYALTTHGSFSPLYEQAQGGFFGRFFFAQAQSLVHGHLNVDPAQLQSECWIRQGRCYGYFGLTPSLLRVPLLPILTAANRSLTPVYMTVALSLAVASALGIACCTLTQLRRTWLITFFFVAVAISLGPASVLLSVARPAVYEEAIAWSVAFALLSVYCFLRWWSTPGRGWTALLVLSLALSSNARPTTMPLAVALGAGIAVRALLEQGHLERVRTVLLGAVVAVVPVATCLGVYWLKFHTLVPSRLLNPVVRESYMQHLVSLPSVRLAPTALLAYLRPDALSLSSMFPFVQFRFGPWGGVPFLGVTPGTMHIEPFSTLPDDMPFAVALVIVSLAYWMRAVSGPGAGVRATTMSLLRAPFTYCLLGTAASAGVMLSDGAITNRYLADTFPLVVVALVLAARQLTPRVARLPRSGAVVVLSLVSLLLVWALVVNLGLEYRLWWSAQSWFPAIG